MNGLWWQHLSVFLISASLSLLFTPLAVRFAIRRGVVDTPGGHKSHSSPVPYLGGVAIVLAFVVTVMTYAVVFSSRSEAEEIAKVLGIALILAVVGLIDDLFQLSVLLRLCVEILAGVALFALQLGATIVDNEFLNLMVTVVWVVGLINAFNMSDNMDGLSGGLATIAATCIFLVAASNGQVLVASLGVAVAGCSAGFLRSNAFPARIYMGDAGAYFLGFLISYLGLKLKFLTTESNSMFLVPLLIVSVVVLDTCLVVVTRLLHGVSPFQGGKDHMSHRLIKLGLPVPIAVALIHYLAAIAGMSGFVVARVDEGSRWIIAALVGTTLMLAGVLLARVPVYSTSRYPLYRVTKMID